MRIISQDKQTDIPYKRSILIIDTASEGTFFIDAYIYDKYFWLGTYHSLDDAKAVLWAIAANKKAGKDYYEMPQHDEELAYAYKKM